MSLNSFEIKHQKPFLKLLQKFEEIFHGILGKHIRSDYIIELHEHAKPLLTKSFLMPNIHKVTLKKGVNRLIKIGVLKKIHKS